MGFYGIQIFGKINTARSIQDHTRLIIRFLGMNPILHPPRYSHTFLQDHTRSLQELLLGCHNMSRLGIISTSQSNFGKKLASVCFKVRVMVNLILTLMFWICDQPQKMF